MLSFLSYSGLKTFILIQCQDQQAWKINSTDCNIRTCVLKACQDQLASIMHFTVNASKALFQALEHFKYFNLDCIHKKDLVFIAKIFIDDAANLKKTFYGNYSRKYHWSTLICQDLWASSLFSNAIAPKGILRFGLLYTSCVKIFSSNIKTLYLNSISRPVGWKHEMKQNSE